MKIKFLRDNMAVCKFEVTSFCFYYFILLLCFAGKNQRPCRCISVVASARVYMEWDGEWHGTRMKDFVCTSRGQREGKKSTQKKSVDELLREWR
jgi:hypothetical protein